MEGDFFGAYVKKDRKEKGLSQELFAKRCEVSTVYISKIERKINCIPSDDIVKRMAKVLEQNEDELLKKAHKFKVEIGKMELSPFSLGEIEKTENEFFKKIARHPQLIELLDKILLAEESVKIKFGKKRSDEILSNLIELFKNHIDLLNKNFL